MESSKIDLTKSMYELATLYMKKNERLAIKLENKKKEIEQLKATIVELQKRNEDLEHEVVIGQIKVNNLSHTKRILRHK